MDNLDAPQWADFTAPSPQVSLDDYFLRRAHKFNYRENFDLVDSDSPNITSTINHNKSRPPVNETLSKNDSALQKTPKKPVNVKGKSSSCKKEKVKETTYENVLTEAMNNLQLSFKMKHGEKSFNKSCLMDSPAYQTPVKRMTRSMCTQAMNASIADLDGSHYISLDCGKSDEAHDPESTEENKESLVIDKHEELSDSPKDEQTSQFRLELTSTSTENETSQVKSELEQEKDEELDKEVQNAQENKNENILQSKVVTAFTTQQSEGNRSHGKKKVTKLTGNVAWHKQVRRRMSINFQRCKSMSKPSTQNKYVSMAEAVTKFQRATPQRFHSTTVKTTRTEQLRKMSFKLTKATSPALMCKNRSRPVTAISSEEKERLELEKLRQNQIKANPVPKDILKRPAALRKVEKKVITNPEPFHLTGTRKGQPPSKQIQEIKRPHRLQHKTVPSIVSNDDKSVTVKDEEVLYFGIPLEPGKSKKRTTKIQPFSFEARYKELEMKKQEKLKKNQEAELQKAKVEFHARPVPAAVKTPALNKVPVKSNSMQKSSRPKITIARSLSFEDRNKQIQKKKEERIQQLLEKEKIARVFKAHPVPEFKPVLVRGTSRDNLHKKSNENLHKRSNENLFKKSNENLHKRSNENLLKKSNENLLKRSTENLSKSHNTNSNNKKIDSLFKKSQEKLTAQPKNFIKRPITIPFVPPKKTIPPSTTIENQENKKSGAVPKIMEPKCKLSQKSVAVLTELNTDKRAKQRKEFDEHIKQKEIVEEELKKVDEVSRLTREKAQQQELRKMAEHKARPMPTFKPMNILKSNKPLTDAQSPAWAKRNGSTSK